MFTWTYEYTITTKATQEQVWAIWEKTSEWHKWDEGNEYVNLEGEFVPGTTGVFKPVGSSGVKFMLLEVEKYKRFKDRSYLPLTYLDFTHIYIPNSNCNGGQITHKVEFTGWLVWFFAIVIGYDIKKTLPQTLLRLSNLALEVNTK